MNKNELTFEIFPRSELVKKTIHADFTIDVLEVVRPVGSPFEKVFFCEGQGSTGNFHYKSPGFILAYVSKEDNEHLFFPVMYQGLIAAFEDHSVSTIFISATTKTEIKVEEAVKGIWYGVKSAFTDIGSKTFRGPLKVYLQVKDEVVVPLRNKISEWIEEKKLVN